MCKCEACKSGPADHNHPEKPPKSGSRQASKSSRSSNLGGSKGKGSAAGSRKASDF